VFNHLVDRGVERQAAQRFVLQSVMAMFAEDIGLLPRHLFSRAVTDAVEGASAYDLLFGLFREMNRPGVTPGGRFAGTPYFNGGLYREIGPFELEPGEVQLLLLAVSDDWSQVRPAIFGTLFEQSLGKDERHAYGAHFTSELDVMKVVRPTLVEHYQARIEEASSLPELGAIEQELISLRVLDPACGSGNFLYLAYRALRKLEKRLQERQDELRRGNVAPIRLAFISPHQFHGIDINPFAVEIAKATLMLARKLAADELGDERQVLPLDDLDANFIAGDALEVEWPQANIIIGNPPFLGRHKVIEARGARYAAWLTAQYPEVVGKTDYVAYWFRKAHDALPPGGRAGLVGTTAIRTGNTRGAALDYVIDRGGVIYDAVQNQKWSGEAGVTVSIVNWTKGTNPDGRRLWLAEGTVPITVDGIIPGSLSAATDVRTAKRLGVNTRPKVVFEGQHPGHEGFVLSPEEAQRLVARDPKSAQVIYPYLIGRELVGDGIPQRFVIDFQTPDAMTAAAQAPAAFQRIRERVLPHRQAATERERQRNEEALGSNPKAKVTWHQRNFLSAWWQQAWPRPAMVAALEALPRYIAVAATASEHRLPVFSFVSSEIRPSNLAIVFAFADDYSFGILQSNAHISWFRERCSRLKTDPRYTSRAVFDTFPWPQAPAQPAVDRVTEIVRDLLGFRAERMAQGINLGQQYDSLRQPGRSRLRDLHDHLDLAVLDVYGFDPNEDLLAQILALNLSVAEQEKAGGAVRGPGPQGLANTSRTDWRIEPLHRLA
jgi:SAM-dependent methyltransferase